MGQNTSENPDNNEQTEEVDCECKDNKIDFIQPSNDFPLGGANVCMTHDQVDQAVNFAHSAVALSVFNPFALPAALINQQWWNDVKKKDVEIKETPKEKATKAAPQYTGVNFTYRFPTIIPSFSTNRCAVPDKK